MPIYQNFHLAHTIEDALRVLSTASTPVRILAGGTDFLLDLQQGRHPPVGTLVDVTRIPELNQLEIRANSLFVGSAVPLNQVWAAALVCQHAQALSEAAGLIGGPQVRNTATLGGNVAHALPAADGSIALLSLDARAEIASLDGTRLEHLTALYKGPGKSALDPQRDLLVGFHLPLTYPGQASAFVRVMRPQGVALPILNMSVWLQRSGDLIQDIRIAIGPAGPTPQRARSAEECLLGQAPTPGRIDYAWQTLIAALHFRSSPLRAGAEYRRHLSAYLLEESVMKAWERASQPETTARLENLL